MRIPNLTSGACIEFEVSGNSITIYGNVRKGNNVTITGDFTDTEGKLKQMELGSVFQD